MNILNNLISFTDLGGKNWEKHSESTRNPAETSVYSVNEKRHQNNLFP